MKRNRDNNDKEHSLLFRMAVTFTGGVIWIVLMSLI